MKLNRRVLKASKDFKIGPFAEDVKQMYQSE